MPPWVSWLPEVFKGSDGQWNWPWIGAALLAAGAAIAAVTKGIWAVFKFFAEQRKKGDENKGGGANVTHSGQGPASGHDRGF